METLKVGEVIDFHVMSMTKGKGKVLAVNSAAVRIHSYSLHGMGDAEMVYPWSQFTHIKVLMGSRTEMTNEDNGWEPTNH